MGNLQGLIDEFRKIQPKFSRFYARMLDSANLTLPQYALLSELTQVAPKPMTMTAISRKLYISKPAVTSLVDRLEKQKFIKRIDHPKDRRISLLELQAPGKKVVTHMQGKILKVILSAVKPFSDKERQTIEKFYSSISKSIDETLIGPKK